jgi:drug/metabolite transporter (DMT)-like permease
MGPLFVAIAAILWATDAVVRYPLVQRGIDPVAIVFIDHLIGVGVLTPYYFLRYRKTAAQISLTQWAGLFLIGGGASALATVLFTASFRYVNPSASILLQKLQPVFVVLLAMLFLGERPARAFWAWAPVALAAGLAISFPAFRFDFLSGISPSSKGSLCALAAAGIWALATVIGKSMVSKLPPTVVTYWRFVFGLAATGAMLALADARFAGVSEALRNPSLLGSFLYISLVPGMLALLLYYQGMRRTPATTTTFMELLFPVSAVAVNTIFLKTELLPIQAAAALLLLFAVTQISLVNRR